MEKVELNEISSKYSLESKLHYKDTLSDGQLLFSNMQPAIKEFENEDLKKFKENEHSEVNVIKSFKSVTHIIFNKGNLVYNTENNKFYKVIDLQTDSNSCPTSATLSVKNGTELLEIKDQDSFNHFKDSINLNIVVGSNWIVSIKQRLYDKFENSLSEIFKCEGIKYVGYKLFYKSKQLDPKLTVAQLDDICENDYILVTEGLGNPSKFSRFNKREFDEGWSCSRNCRDGIAFIPQQNVKVWGFSVFGIVEKPTCWVKYLVVIDGKEVESNTVVSAEVEDKYFVRIKLEGIYDAPAGSKIEFSWWISPNLTDTDCVDTYYGEMGEQFDKVENEHMGLFKIEDGGESWNGTSVYSGQLPEIFYYLI